MPVQLIYGGKTDACHPRFNFPPDWDVTHTESHWSTSATMVRYVEKLIVPWVKAKREALGLDEEQKALAIFDAYTAHRCNTEMHRVLEENNIVYIYVPASCTSQLQPLDSDGGVNAAFKRELKGKFIKWYAERITSGLAAGLELDDIKVDLSLTNLKPKYANWVLGCFDAVKNQDSTMLTGWMKTGILDAFGASESR